MVTIIVETPFKWSPDGNQVIEVECGEQKVPERCALVAVEHLKFATLPDAKSDARARSGK